jgi:hypothetical protein
MSGQDLVPANSDAPLVHGMTIDLTQDSDDDAPDVLKFKSRGVVTLQEPTLYGAGYTS